MDAEENKKKKYLDRIDWIDWMAGCRSILTGDVRNVGLVSVGRIVSSFSV